MKILITGNMGYVGSVLVRHLRSVFPKSQLIGYDLGYFAHSLTAVSSLPETVLDRQIFGDVRQFPESLLEGIDAVVHLAAISNDPMGHRFEAVTEEINHRSGVEIAKLSLKNGVKHFVFASSCSVYGAAEGGPRKESDPLNPLTAYARSKIATENFLSQWGQDRMTVTSLRFATACGMSERLRLDLVLNDKGVEVSINTNAAPDKRSYQVDFSLFKKLAPKHQPLVTLDQAVRDLTAGLEKMNFIDGNFRDSS